MQADRIIYIEPFSGISGDMFVGALLDLGLDLELLREKLRVLPLRGYELRLEKCLRAGIQASKFEVHVQAEASHRHADKTHDLHAHRNFREIREMIESSALSPWVKEKAAGAFSRLAEAEGKIHNQPVEEIHFHEVGAVDSIIDIVGSMIVLEELLPARLISASINVGQGTVACRHGIYPVPAPATQELLMGMPTYANSVAGELTTPTGAALLATLVQSFGPRPLMKVTSTGYGAGGREIKGSANVLRITVGEEYVGSRLPAADEQVAVVEATIDDMNPQIFGYFQEKALNSGALDVYFAPIQMKKNRPAVKLTVICMPDQLDALSRLIFHETTTLGIRYTVANRKTLQREFLQVETEYGAVSIKISVLDGKRLNFVPEYEDCRRLAEEKGVALKEVIGSAARAYLQCADPRA